MQFSILRNSVKSHHMTNWSLIRLGTEKQHCSSSCPTPTTASTSSFPCVIHSFSICSARKQTMCTAEGFPFMCGALLMNARISDRFRNWRNSSQQSEAVKFPLVLYYRRKVNSKPFTKTTPTQSSATVTADCFSAAVNRQRLKKSPHLWEASDLRLFLR